MISINRICVFCGSSKGAKKVYSEQAVALGQALAARKIGLVYGGGGIGLMGAAANAALDSGGRVIGVIPRSLAVKERIMQPLARSPRLEMHVVKTMHERKALMVELADAFIALPGGLGTFDELFEAMTWAQLGIHRKPIGLLNVAGYFDPFLATIDRAIDEGFMMSKYRGLIVVSLEISDLFERLVNYEPQESIVKWVEMDET